MLENEGARRRGKSRKLDNCKHGFRPRSAKQGTMLGPGFVKKKPERTVVGGFATMCENCEKPPTA